MKFLVSAFTIFAVNIAREPVNACEGCNGVYPDPPRLALSEAVSHECAGELYDLSVVVHGAHILLSAEPKCEGSLRSNECQECPSLIFHDISSPAKGGEVSIERAIHEFDLNEDLTEDHEGLVLGTFNLGTLVKAYDDASDGASKRYNLFTNNCAGLPINMGLNLGLDPTDRKIVSFVSHNLSKKAPSSLIMDELTNHEAGMAMIETHGKEGAVIEAYVSTYINDSVRTHNFNTM
mmetsp:Transcript_3606/g.4076  ORF Transcript_3606/g.4076 Transcript_3606/m.4076 type:complete len:235 (-) Transcript_3606:49-753(-)